MTSVIIGAPVFDRAWILPAWFEAIERQAIPMEDLGFVFLTGPNDGSTLQELLKFHAKHPELRCFDIVLDTSQEHKAHVDGQRHWERSRYHVMAYFRNTLLDKVKCYNPDRYFSLDTDILLEDQNTILQLIELTVDRPAVGTLLFMTPEGGQFPSVMNWFTVPGDRAFRLPTYPFGSVFKSDIIMAAVMMTKPVYSSVQYAYHHQGEDVGWSAECAKAGFELYSASHLYTPHIMNTKGLERYLAVGDPRGQYSEESR